MSAWLRETLLTAGIVAAMAGGAVAAVAALTWVGW